MNPSRQGEKPEISKSPSSTEEQSSVNKSEPKTKQIFNENAESLLANLNVTIIVRPCVTGNGNIAKLPGTYSTFHLFKNPKTAQYDLGGLTLEEFKKYFPTIATQAIETINGIERLNENYVQKYMQLVLTSRDNIFRLSNEHDRLLVHLIKFSNWNKFFSDTKTASRDKRYYIVDPVAVQQQEITKADKVEEALKIVKELDAESRDIYSGALGITVSAASQLEKEATLKQKALESPETIINLHANKEDRYYRHYTNQFLALHLIERSSEGIIHNGTIIATSLESLITRFREPQLNALFELLRQEVNNK